MFQQLAHYRIEAEIGEGAFATVYRAFDIRLERYVALKVLKPFWMADAHAVARFMQEARLMARLEHPHIVTIHDVGQVEGQVYLAQRLIEGESLAARLKRGAMVWDEMIAIVRPIASALDYAHARGLVHRDIKPQNILLAHTGQAFLSDFGLVKATEGSMSLSLSTGGVVGTPNYMAPEQWEGDPVSPATDVYALACVVAETLTGKVLFDGEGPSVVMKRHLIDGPSFPAAWSNGVPPGVKAVLARALRQQPKKRTQSAGALVANLEKLANPTLIETMGAAVSGGMAQLPRPKKPALPSATDVWSSISKIVPRWKPPRFDVRRFLKLPDWASPAGWNRKLVVAALLAVLVGGGAWVGLSRWGIVSAPPLAFVSNRDGNSEIYMMDVDGKSTRLTDHPAIDAHPSWSPDHSRLAFASKRSGNWDIYVLDIKSRELIALTQNTADDTQPAWSMDGQYIAFTSNRSGKREIYFAGPEKIEQVTFSPGTSESWEPAWGGGGSLIFTSNRDGKREIYYTSTSKTERITHSPGKSESWEPAWSAIGNYLLFVSNRDGQNDVYLVASSDKVTRHVTLSPKSTASLSPVNTPNGNFIAFSSNRDGNYQVYSLVDGKTIQLTHIGANWAPAW